MKKKMLILTGMLIFSSFIFSTSCYFYEYEKKVDKVIYSEGINPGNHKRNTKEINRADLKTFVVLDRRGAAKDKNSFYYMGKIVKGIDGSTLEIVYKETKNPGLGTKIVNGVEVSVPISTASHCFTPYITEIKDKNGNYLIKDIQAGMYELTE